jgi:hypothetical protein
VGDKMNAKKWIYLLLVILFFGCASIHDSYYWNVISKYEAELNCCTSISEFVFEKAQIGYSKSFDLVGGKSPAYQFETGKSYFKAFLLPQKDCPYKVRILSYQVGDSYRPYVFFPHILTLDENFTVIRSTDPQTFRFKTSGMIERIKNPHTLKYKLEGKICFTEKNSAEKYLIVLTTEELILATTPLSVKQTKGLPYHHPRDAMDAVFLLTLGLIWMNLSKEVVMMAEHSPSGRIRVSLIASDR